MSDHRSHLHAVPTCTLFHDVPVERVQNDFVGKLQRLVESDSILGVFSFGDVASFLSSPHFISPCFDKSFEVVSSIAEVSDCVDVEWILTHTDSVRLSFCFCFVNALMSGLTVRFNSFLQLFSIHLGRVGFRFRNKFLDRSVFIVAFFLI